MPNAAYPPLYILRHGETTWNAEGRLQGRHDSPLTDRGRAQAACQQRILQACDLRGFRLISSPQGRALATAQIALDGVAGTLETDPDLVEVGMGDWAGGYRQPLLDQTGAEDGFALYDLAPNGEGLPGLRHRCTAFLARMTDPAVLVTHGITSRMLRLILTGHSGCDVRKMQGGQGVVYRVVAGEQTCLTEGG